MVLEALKYNQMVYSSRNKKDRWTNMEKLKNLLDSKLANVISHILIPRLRTFQIAISLIPRERERDLRIFQIMSYDRCTIEKESNMEKLDNLLDSERFFSLFPLVMNRLQKIVGPLRKNQTWRNLRIFQRDCVITRQEFGHFIMIIVHW